MFRRAARWFRRRFGRPREPEYTSVIVQRWTILNDDDERLASRPVSGRLYRDGRFVPHQLPNREILDDADALAILERRKSVRRKLDEQRLDAQRAAEEAPDEQAELEELDLELPPWEE